jgi:DNA-binding MarR family transcriptional regulator/GNAT superfamily N-acetyltransferase
MQPALQDSQLRCRSERVRRFNRFYTRKIGVLREGLLESPFSLTEVRVLYELAHRPDATASAIASELDLDPGYLSRILRKFTVQKLVHRRPSPEDARQTLLSLSPKGWRVFNPLEERSTADVAAMLAKLPSAEQERLLRALQTVEGLLAPSDKPAAYILRTHRPGDIGWVIERHGALYAREYGWTVEFEALVAEIAATFLRNYDAARERCWIAERDGVNLGSVFLVKETDHLAKLRLLLVEPEARGLGIGRRLVAECVAFAREAGYRMMTLWTQSILTAARHLYEEAGFRLTQQKPHRSFGADLVGETWELDLS